MTLFNAKIGLLMLGLSLIFLFPAKANAVIPFEDDFNDYIADATLAGQGNWLGTSATILIKNDGDCLEGKCIEQTGTESDVYKVGTSATDGTIYVYFRLEYRPTANYFLYFRDAEYTGSVAIFDKRPTGAIEMETALFLDTLIATTSTSTWYELNCEYQNLSDPNWSNRKIRCQVDNNGFTEWRKIATDITNFGLISPSIPTTGDRFDYISGSEYISLSTLTINSPVSGSTASSTFSANITYNKESEDWDKIMLVFENWEVESTCPVYGTPEWQSEYNLGYFNYQSYPYFSEILTATSGTTIIEVENLDENLYNCVRCVFFNESTGEGSTEKCPDYTLTISGFIPPAQPLPIKKWADYYAIHSDPKYETSTEIFNTIANAFDTIIQKVGSFLVSFRVIFDSKQAEAKGSELGGKIPLARGYLKPINDFFGGNLPVSELFIFCVLVMIIVGVFRAVKIIVQFIRG